MAKRFIDTGLFDDDWFMDLSKDCKLLWIYFITKCDHAGMIKLNDKLCRVQTDIEDLTETLKQLSNRIVRVSEHLYFIPKFIEFQYPGFPNSRVRQQISAVEILTKHGLIKEGILTVSKELNNSYDNEHDSVIVNDNVKGRRKPFIPPTLDEVRNYFIENGYSSEAAERAFKHYSLGNWHDTKGDPVLSWKQKMNTVWFKEENKAKPRFIMP